MAIISKDEIKAGAAYILGSVSQAPLEAHFCERPIHHAIPLIFGRNEKVKESEQAFKVEPSERGWMASA